MKSSKIFFFKIFVLIVTVCLMACRIETQPKPTKLITPSNFERITIPELNLVLIPVQGGSFMMGSANGDKDEMPTHKVTLTRSFWMGRTEVTQGQWKKVMGTTIWEQRNKANQTWADVQSSNHPMPYISWYEAVEFCKKLTARERTAGRLPASQEYRLPTEAEWEYCARGGASSKGYKYSGSDVLKEVAWAGKDSGRRTNPVGKKKANELGLHDMNGNLWEWCQDFYWFYSRGPKTDPICPARGSKSRVIRGGSFGLPVYSRVSAREENDPSTVGCGLGFRIVRALCH